MAAILWAVRHVARSRLAPDLPDNYYEDAGAGQVRPHIDVYIHSMFGRSLSGKPVFQYERQRHVAKDAPHHLAEFHLCIGLDAGREPYGNAWTGRPTAGWQVTTP